jgi:hypothetical protein
MPSQRFETAHRHSQGVSVHRHAASEVRFARLSLSGCSLMALGQRIIEE